MCLWNPQPLITTRTSSEKRERETRHQHSAWSVSYKRSYKVNIQHHSQGDTSLSSLDLKRQGAIESATSQVFNKKALLLLWLLYYIQESYYNSSPALPLHVKMCDNSPFFIPSLDKEDPVQWSVWAASLSSWRLNDAPPRRDQQPKQRKNEHVTHRFNYSNFFLYDSYTSHIFM